MFCTNCGTSVREHHRFCATCGTAVEVEQVPVAAAAALPASVDQSGSPALDWTRGLSNGLVGYLVVQVLFFFLFRRSTADVYREWPLYVFFGFLWTFVFALNLSTGVAWGVVLAVIVLDTLLWGVIPISSALMALERVLIDAFVGVLVLALIGLIRGKLEPLGLSTRQRVASLFAVAGGLFMVLLVFEGAFG